MLTSYSIVHLGRAEPHTVLACLGLGAYRALLSRDLPFELARINVRLSSYSPLTPLKDLKSNLVEKFVAVRGNVVRVGPVRYSVKRGCVTFTTPSSLPRFSFLLSSFDHCLAN